MTRGVALTIGFFDGVHLGHRALLDRTLAAAAARGLGSAAVTFDMHRFEVLRHKPAVQTLTTTEEKRELLLAAGLDAVHVLHFTPEFAAQSGRHFVETTLLGELRARFLVVGHDFRFGHSRACGVSEMATYAARGGVEVESVAPVALDGERISSNAIRRAVLAGDVANAARALGRPYRLSGTVVSGRRLGREIGFPTANLAVDARKVLPAAGVYATRLWLDDGAHDAVTNLGVRPTLDDGAGTSIETHLLDFDGDLYERFVSLDFHHRLRGERRFADLPALAAQIGRDCHAARAALAGGA